MGKQYEMAFSIGAKVQGSFGSAFKSASSSVQSLQSTINELNKKQSDISSYQKTQQALEKTRDKLKLYEQQYANMKAAIEGNENATYQEQNAMLAKGKAIDDLKAKQEALEKKLQSTGEALQEEGVNLDNLETESKQAAEEVEGLRTEQEALAGSSESAASGVMQLVSALGAMEAIKAVAQAFKECADQAIAFESSMASVKRTVGGTDSFISELGENFKDLSTEIPITTEELAQIASTAGQLGIQQNKVEQFTEVMAKLATTTDLTADEAATMLAQFANITGVDDYERLGSTIAELGDSTATTASKVVQMSQGMAAAASVAGFSPTDIMAISAAVGSLGIEAQAGSTSMSQLISTLYKATETGDKLQDFASVAGMSAQEFKESWGVDAAGTLEKFISGLNDVERNGKSAIVILDDLGINNVRQQKAILGLANAEGLLSKTITQANAAWKANTALNQKASIMYQTTEAKLTMMNNSFDNMKVAIGDAFTPVIGAAADAVTGLMGPISDFIEANPALVQGIGSAMAVVGAFTGVVAAWAAAAKLAAAASEILTASMAHFLLIGAGIAAVTGLIVALSSALSGSTKDMKTLDEEFDTMNANFVENKNIVDLCEKYKQLSSDATSAVTATKELGEFGDIEITLTGDPTDDVIPENFMVEGKTDVELTPEPKEGSLLNGDDFMSEDGNTVEIEAKAGDEKLEAKELMSSTGIRITAEGPDDEHKLEADVFVNGKEVKFTAEWENREAMLKDVEAFKKSATEAKSELTKAQQELNRLQTEKQALIDSINNASDSTNLGELSAKLGELNSQIFFQNLNVSTLKSNYEDAAGKYLIAASAAETLAEKDAELAGILDELGISTDFSTGTIEQQTAAILAQVDAKERLAKASIAQTRADIYGNINEQAKQYAKTMRETAEAQDHFDRAVADSDVTNRYAAMSAEEISAHYKELLNTLDEMEEKEGFSPDAESYKEVVAEANELYNILTGMPDDWSEYADGMTDWADSFEYVAGNAENWNQIIADINEDIATYGKIVGEADNTTKLFLDNLVEGVNTGAVSIEEVKTLLTSAFANEENSAELLAQAMEYIRQKTTAAKDAQEGFSEEEQNVISAVQPVIDKMNALAKSYTDAYNAAYSSINGMFKLFEEVSMEDQAGETKTSVDDMIKSLTSQTDYMQKYAENMQAASKMGVDEGLLAKLSDGSVESAKYLQEIVTNGEGKIAQLNDAFQKTEEGKQVFSATMAQCVTDFDNKMTELETELNETIATMDKSSETADSAAKTVQAYAESAAAQYDSVKAAFDLLSSAAQINAKINFNVGGFTVGKGILGSLFGFAGGTNNAPRGAALVGEEGPELMYLHGGEQILNTQDTQRVLDNNAMSAEPDSRSGNTIIEFKPQYNITGSMNAQELQGVLEEHDANMRDQLEDMLRDIGTDRYRREYA